MSHIAFPSDAPSSSSSSHHSTNSNFYSGFEAAGSSSSGFQMNPLSSHPPRTPRTSIIASSHHGAPQHMEYGLGMSVYEDANGYSEYAGEDGPGEGNATGNGNGNGNGNGKEKADVDLEAVELDDEEDSKVKEAERRVRREEVWRDMVVTSNGRDKTFKLIQYSIRVYLLFHTSITLRRATRAKWEVAFVKRLQNTMGGLSLTRKCLLLFNWLAPLTAVQSQSHSSSSLSLSSSKAKHEPLRPGFLPLLLHSPPPLLLTLINAIADDVATLSKLGLLGKRLGERAGRFADWCWLLSTLVGLVENGVERAMIGGLTNQVEGRLYAESMSGTTAKSKSHAQQRNEDKELARLHRQDWWLQLHRAKLVCDLVFVSYDVFHFKRAAEPVKAFTGLAAAILSSAKLYDRNRTTLLKAVSLAL